MNMSILKTLFTVDMLSIRTWLTTKRVSKLLVIFSFAVLFCLVISGIYYLTKAFFLYVSNYKMYGILTASYIINASIVVLFILMVMAAVTALVGFMLEKSPEHEFVLSQATPTTILPMLYFLRSTIINIALVLLVFTPIAVAYQYVFQNHDVLFYYGRLVYAFVSLVLLTNSIAVFISYAFAYTLQRQTIYTGIFGLVLFFLVMFGIFYVIFPKSLFLMTEIQSVDFLQEYHRLPITSPFLPTVWITDTIFQGFSFSSLLLLLVTFVSLIASYVFQKKYFIRLYRRIHPQEHAHFSSRTPGRLFRNFPFLMKDYLSIARDPADAGYVFFLLGIAAFFFIFLRVGLSRAYRGTLNIQGYLAVFAFLWLGFFVTAFLLRIIYPLMAREGSSRWFVFSLPFGKKAILKQKIIFGYLIAIPISVFSILVWFFIPNQANIYVIIGFSLIMVITLAQTHVLLGAIAPDYENGDAPERVSTSAMGLVTLTFSFLYIVAGAYLMFDSLQNLSSVFSSFILYAGSSLLFLFILTHAVSKYNR